MYTEHFGLFWETAPFLPALQCGNFWQEAEMRLWRENSDFTKQLSAGCQPGQWVEHPSFRWKYHRLFDNKCLGICCFNVPSKKDISNHTGSQNTCWGLGHAWKSSINNISFSSLEVSQPEYIDHAWPHLAARWNKAHGLALLAKETLILCELI